MKKSTIVKIIVCVVALAAIVALSFTLGGTHMMECPDCEGSGALEGAATVCETCGGTGTVKAQSMYYSTFMALVPPIIAIGLALITKEVYSSLFIGILAGGLFYSNFNVVDSFTTVVQDGLIGSLADSSHGGKART